jgi:hypothetical protein
MSAIFAFAFSSSAETLGSETSWQLNASNFGVLGVSLPDEKLLGLESWPHAAKSEQVPTASANNFLDIHIK